MGRFFINDYGVHCMYTEDGIVSLDSLDRMEGSRGRFIYYNGKKFFLNQKLSSSVKSRELHYNSNVIWSREDQYRCDLYNKDYWIKDFYS